MQGKQSYDILIFFVKLIYIKKQLCQTADWTYVLWIDKQTEKIGKKKYEEKPDI